MIAVARDPAPAPVAPASLVTGQHRRCAIERQVRRAYFTETPQTSCSVWAETNRYVSQEHNPEEPGPWRNARAPYLVEIMDALSDPDVERVVFRKSGRMGGTEVANNFTAWAIDQRPRPMLIMHPTDGDARDWSKESLDPLLRDTRRLRGLVKDSDIGRRVKGSTILYKKFGGGYLAIVGSNAARGLRRRSIAYLVASEVDGFALEARGGRGKEGDPLNLGIRRTQNVRGRKIYLESTPAEKPSRICREYERTDQREYWVPCPHCGYRQTLKWANLEWEHQDPRTVVYRCGDYDRKPDGTVRRTAGCGEAIHEHHKAWMLAPENGAKWIPRFPERTGNVRGYFIWAAYSPFVSWVRLVTEWLALQGDREQLKTFVNTVWGEEWEDKQSVLDESVLGARRVKYAAAVPAPVGTLTAGIDVQGDRLEATVVGWGAREQAWWITHEILPGNPGSEGDVWERLDAFLGQGWPHETGQLLPIRSACIDVGGHHTTEAYAFVHARPGRNIWAIRGSPVAGAAAVSKPFKVAGFPGLVRFDLGTDALKDSVFARLQVLEPGPRYVHFPNHLPDEFFEQLTAEVARTKWINRRRHRVYELRRGRRNEALDCAVYALAALYLLGPLRQQLGELADKLAKGEAPFWPGRSMGGRRRRRERFQGFQP